MMYFLSVLVGIGFLIWGLLMTLQATSAMNKTLKGFKALREDTYYLELQKLRNELDELNYSYYEILSDLTTRLDAAETIISNRIGLDAGEETIDTGDNLERPRESYKGLHATVEPLPYMAGGQSVGKDRLDAQRKMTIRKLIEEGLSDQEIARALGIGIGEVGVLRRMDTTK